MRTVFAAATAAIVLSSLTACASFGESRHVLSRGEWRLVQVDYEDAYPMDLTPEQQQRHWLDFGSDGRLQIGLDCNNGGANWTASEPYNGEGSITIGPINSTRAFCQPPTFSDEMSADLSQVEHYSVSSNGREMELFNQRVTFRFAAR